jgi:hypothetical protein
VSRSWSISQRMPSRTAASVRRQVVGALERLRNDVDIELKETDRWVTTFIRIQCWGRDKRRLARGARVQSPAESSVTRSPKGVRVGEYVRLAELTEPFRCDGAGHA